MLSSSSGGTCVHEGRAGGHQSQQSPIGTVSIIHSVSTSSGDIVSIVSIIHSVYIVSSGTVGILGGSSGGSSGGGSRCGGIGCCSQRRVHPTEQPAMTRMLEEEYVATSQHDLLPGGPDPCSNDAPE